MYRLVAEILLVTGFSSKKLIFLCSYLRSGSELSNDCLYLVLSIRVIDFWVIGFFFPTISCKVFLEDSCNFLPQKQLLLVWKVWSRRKLLLNVQKQGEKTEEIIILDTI